MQLFVHTFNLELKHTFKITHESRDSQPTLIVELRDGAFVGYGEATATRYYGLDVFEMKKTLLDLKDLIEATPLDTPEAFWATMAPHLEGHTFEQCALDVAAHDLYAKKQGKPLYRLWGLQLKDLPISNYTLGMASVEETVRKIKEMPWPLYKIKLGGDNDLNTVRALRKHTDAVFRVDANTGWTADQTIRLAPAFKELGVEFIEQPLPVEALEQMKVVRKESVLPIVADESCQVESDISKCAGYFHVVNIKLMKCGGLTPARRMIAQARSLGLKVMVGCMTESSIGISAIGHLLPLLDYVDMDGALLLKEDIAAGVEVLPDGYRFPNRNGTGAVLKV